jgi:hypothetical protein
VTGHSIGMTMIEYPRIREGYDVEEGPHQRTHSCWARMPQSGWNW